ncbi:MAG: hypothetical protein HYW23_04655 [Candidatus Aenigmarchaeota archaeon]|nr:hypothetical protein [Candidatus Aenigmarchaeota archaeon]
MRNQKDRTHFAMSEVKLYKIVPDMSELSIEKDYIRSKLKNDTEMKILLEYLEKNPKEIKEINNLEFLERMKQENDEKVNTLLDKRIKEIEKEQLEILDNIAMKKYGKLYRHLEKWQSFEVKKDAKI